MRQNGAFFEGQDAISTSIYKIGARAQTIGMAGLTYPRPAASSDPLTDNSKTERHFFEGMKDENRGPMPFLRPSAFHSPLTPRQRLRLGPA
jgi:hypothetical protein